MISLFQKLEKPFVGGVASGEQVAGDQDAAHKRFFQLLEQGNPLPVDLKGQVIYYVGPAPAKPGYPVGPAGPTSSYRMDAYTPALLDLGMKGMIGKEMCIRDRPCTGHSLFSVFPMPHF